MASFSTNYSVRIPMPDIAAHDGVALEQLAQFTTPDGLIAVYWIRSTNQAVFEFGDKWYIQNDGYITDSIAEILGVKESVIKVKNLRVGERVGSISEPFVFNYADPEMARQFYTCFWSDYTCDYMIMQADLDYPYDD